MSRNPHIPTDETRKIVRQLASLGTPQAEIAIMVGCSEKTLRLHYREELNEGLEDAKAAVLEALMKKIRAGNTTAMIFYDKCRGGRKETIKEEISGPKGGPLVFSRPVIITPTCAEHKCDELIEHKWRRALGVGHPSESTDRVIRRIQQTIEDLKTNAKK